MAIQDLLTVAIESTFVASVLFFSLQFALFVASKQHRQPTPIAAPVLPTITTQQADANLDAQISRLPNMTALASDSRTYTASLPTVRKTAAKASPKPHSAVISTAPAPAPASPKRYLLRGHEVLLVEDLPFSLPSDFKTYILRGKPVVKVSDLIALGLLK